jgi:hypothetical protein
LSTAEGALGCTDREWAIPAVKLVLNNYTSIINISLKDIKKAGGLQYG